MYILKAKIFTDPLEYTRFYGYYFTKDLTFQRLVRVYHFDEIIDNK